MGVQFNLKDAETVRKTRELAAGSGRSMTEVIRAAIDREWREREERVQESMRRVETIAKEFRHHMPDDWHGRTSREIMDAIYNEDGSFAS